jgi:aspartyl-tRNA synthetase
MSYAEAMDKYGSDRPDLRFGLELVDITDICNQTDFKVFKGAIEAGGRVKAIRVPGGGKLTRKQTDGLAEWVKQFGAGGLPIVKIENGDFATGIAKFIAPVKDALIEKLAAEEGDLIVFGVSERHMGLLGCLLMGGNVSFQKFQKLLQSGFLIGCHPG